MNIMRRVSKPLNVVLLLIPMFYEKDVICKDTESCVKCPSNNTHIDHQSLNCTGIYMAKAVAKHYKLDEHKFAKELNDIMNCDKNISCSKCGIVNEIMEYVFSDADSSERSDTLDFLQIFYERYTDPYYTASRVCLLYKITRILKEKYKKRLY